MINFSQIQENARAQARGVMRRYRKDEEGSMVVEFIFVLMAYIFIITLSFEVGWYAVNSALVDQAVSRSVRDIRIGRNPDVTLESVKAATCDYAAFLPQCMENTHVSLEPVDANNFVLPNTIADCVDTPMGTAPATVFQDGGENELMLVRVCYRMPPLTPFGFIANSSDPDYANGLITTATSAFVNEPNT